MVSQQKPASVVLGVVVVVVAGLVVVAGPSVVVTLGVVVVGLEVVGGADWPHPTHTATTGSSFLL